MTTTRTRILAGLIILTVICAVTTPAYVIIHNQQSQLSVLQSALESRNLISQDEATSLQIGFLKQYPGLEADKVIVPKICEIAAHDKQNNSYVLLNVGGIWAVLSTTPAPTLADNTTAEK